MALAEVVARSTGDAEDDLSFYFPDVECYVRPAGNRVVVQLKRPMKKTKGGIILPDDSRDTEHWNTQVAKVVATGPVAFRNRDNLTEWPEGDWCQPGDFVRVSKYGGDRWAVKMDDGLGDKDEITFVILRDTDVLGVVSDPLAVKAYL